MKRNVPELCNCAVEWSMYTTTCPSRTECRGEYLDLGVRTWQEMDKTTKGRPLWLVLFPSSPRIIVVKCRQGMRGTYCTHGRYELNVNKCGIDNVCVSMSFGELIYIHVFLCIVLWYVDTGLSVGPFCVQGIMSEASCILFEYLIMNRNTSKV